MLGGRLIYQWLRLVQGMPSSSLRVGASHHLFPYGPSILVKNHCFVGWNHTEEGPLLISLMRNQRSHSQKRRCYRNKYLLPPPLAVPPNAPVSIPDFYAHIRVNCSSPPVKTWFHLLYLSHCTLIVFFFVSSKAEFLNIKSVGGASQLLSIPKCKASTGVHLFFLRGRFAASIRLFL